MIQLELLNRPRLQLTPKRLGVFDCGINPSKPLFEALAEVNGLRFGGVTAPPMKWEGLLTSPPRPTLSLASIDLPKRLEAVNLISIPTIELPKPITWERLLALPEAHPKPVISIALPDRPKPLIVETDLSKLYPAHFLMNRILDSAATRISHREQAQTRAMEAMPQPYIPPPEVQQIAAARQILQEATQVQTPAVIPGVERQPLIGLRQRIKGILPSAETVNNVAFFVAANELARAVSYNLEGRLPINPILTYFGVHLMALGYLGVETFAESYKAQARKDAQLAFADTVRALPEKFIRYGVAGGTWNTLSVLTGR